MKFLLKTTRFLIIPLLLICTYCSNVKKTIRPDYVVKNLKIKGFADSLNMVIAGNIVGSDQDELIAAQDSAVYIYTVAQDSATLLYKTIFPDHVLKMKIGDADSDGGDELVIACGYGGYKADKKVEIFIIQSKNGVWSHKEIYSKSSPRPELTYLGIVDTNNSGKNDIVASYFKSKYMVETVFLTKNTGQWKPKIHGTERMATTRSFGILPGSNNPREVIGRAYGDSLGAPGDAYILDGSKRIKLPIYRGVHAAVTIGDGDNDGENEIYLGDGWHQNYGKIARGRLAMVKVQKNKKYKYKLIEDTKGQYEISQINIADVTGDGENEVITRGNQYFRVYKFDKEKKAWKVYADTTIGTHSGTVQDKSYRYSNQFAIGDINGDHHNDVIFNGMQYSRLNDVGVQIYDFGNLTYSYNLAEEVQTKKVNPDSLIGKSAPELSIAQWYNGSFPGINKSRGKVIMLDFWATWCGPCIKMFPTLEKFQKKYGNDGLQILGITRVDGIQTMQDIKKFVDKQHFVYPIGVSKEAFTQLAYGVQPIPHMVLIDKKGIIREYKIGQRDGKELEKEVVKLLKE